VIDEMRTIREEAVVAEYGCYSDGLSKTWRILLSKDSLCTG